MSFRLLEQTAHLLQGFQQYQGLTNTALSEKEKTQLKKLQ